MTAITLHAIDDALARRLKSMARREGKSLNQLAKELLAAALGVAPAKKPRVRNDLGRFCGVLSDADADAIRENLKDFDRIDKDLWK